MHTIKTAITWDSVKAKSNRLKHGVFFSDVEPVFYDPNAISFEDKESRGEARYIVVGLDSLSRLVVVVYTYRDNIIRVIPRGRQVNLSKKYMKKEYDFSEGKRGAVVKTRGKTRITIHLDNEVIEAFRARAEESRRGYQTLINEALREYLANASKPVDSKTLRRILREELHKSS
jgi:uncharacterized DUF497 family protein